MNSTDSLTRVPTTNPRCYLGARLLRGLAVLASLGIVLTNIQPLRGQASSKRTMTFKDLIAMHRVSDPQISPDGSWVSYTVATPDLDANSSNSNIWIVPFAGGNARQLTRGGKDSRARWSPDGKSIAFLSSRNGETQIYSMSLAGGEPAKITSLSTGAENQVWSPDGKSIVFVSNVYPDCKDDACNAERNTAEQKNKVKARVYDKLLFRHWTEWSDGKRNHLFVLNAAGGAPEDLTPGADYDVPPFNLGEPESISFSPDSQEICFTANTDKDEAMSTNGDLFTVPANGSAPPRRITTNPGNDWGGMYSPDGKWIAYRAQLRGGYESDRWRLMLYDRTQRDAKPVNLTETFDLNVESVIWSPNSKKIYFETEEKAEAPIYAIEATPGSTLKEVLSGTFNASLQVSQDGGKMAFLRTTMSMPAEVFAANADGSGTRKLTHHNDTLLAQLDLPKMESFWFEGAGGTQVQGLMLRPPHFDASRKYPMLLLIHGGPQGDFDDSWGYRWNEQLMAAPGYVVVAINPRGSFGYGQKFTEEVSRDWGGKVYEDLMKGVDAAIAKYPFIDEKKLAAAGGSYGGYMVDWIATHTGRFKCLISHAGPYDAVSMYGETEELWFNSWEFGGSPWAKPELYTRWSPSAHAGALARYKTPTLVIGGELDFRVPYTQDLQFFTALQQQNVPSRLIVFPDEGHWVLKPQNSEFWYHNFQEWLAKYLR